MVTASGRKQRVGVRLPWRSAPSWFDAPVKSVDSLKLSDGYEPLVRTRQR